MSTAHSSSGGDLARTGSGPPKPDGSGPPKPDGSGSKTADRIGALLEPRPLVDAAGRKRRETIHFSMDTLADAWAAPANAGSLPRLAPALRDSDASAPADVLTRSMIFEKFHDALPDLQSNEALASQSDEDDVDYAIKMALLDEDSEAALDAILFPNRVDASDAHEFSDPADAAAIAEERRAADLAAATAEEAVVAAHLFDGNSYRVKTRAERQATLDVARQERRLEYMVVLSERQHRQLRELVASRDALRHEITTVDERGVAAFAALVDSSSLRRARVSLPQLLTARADAWTSLEPPLDASSPDATEKARRLEELRTTRASLQQCLDELDNTLAALQTECSQLDLEREKLGEALAPAQAAQAAEAHERRVAARLRVKLADRRVRQQVRAVQQQLSAERAAQLAQTHQSGRSTMRNPQVRAAIQEHSRRMQQQWRQQVADAQAARQQAGDRIRAGQQQLARTAAHIRQQIAHSQRQRRRQPNVIDPQQQTAAQRQMEEKKLRILKRLIDEEQRRRRQPEDSSSRRRQMEDSSTRRRELPPLGSATAASALTLTNAAKRQTPAVEPPAETTASSTRAPVPSNLQDSVDPAQTLILPPQKPRAPLPPPTVRPALPSSGETESGLVTAAPPFSANPSSVVFADYDAPNTYTQTVVLTNTSGQVNTFRLLPLPLELANFFEVRFDAPGRMSAGLTSTVLIVFQCPGGFDQDIVDGVISFQAELGGVFSLRVGCTAKKCLPRVASVAGDSPSEPTCRFPAGRSSGRALALERSPSQFDVLFRTCVAGQRVSRIVRLVNDGAVATECSVVPVSKAEGDSAEDSPTFFAASFVVTGKTPVDESITLPPYGTCDLCIEFAPPYNSSESVLPAQTNGTENEDQLGDLLRKSTRVQQYRVEFSRAPQNPITLECAAETGGPPLFISTDRIEFNTCTAGQLYRQQIVLRSAHHIALKYELVAPRGRDGAAAEIELNPEYGFVQPREPCSVWIKFRPSAATWAAQLAAEGPGAAVPFSVPLALTYSLYGVSYSIPLRVEGAVTSSQLVLSTGVLHFGRRVTLQERAIAPLGVTNGSALPQSVALHTHHPALSVAPADGAPFARTAVVQLAPRETRIVRVGFAPQSPGLHEDRRTMLVTCRNLLDERFDVRCVGTGVVPMLRFAHNSVQFAPTAPGNVRYATTPLRNPSGDQGFAFRVGDPRIVSVRASSGLNLAPASVRQLPLHVWPRSGVVGGRETRLLHLALVPALLEIDGVALGPDALAIEALVPFHVTPQLSEAAALDRLLHASGPAGSTGPAQTLFLRLVVPCVPPALEIDPAAVDFGRALVGERAIREITVRNLQDNPLVVHSRGGLNPLGPFSLLDPLPLKLAPLEERRLRVAFAPASDAGARCSLELVHGASAAALRLRGHGVVPRVHVDPAVVDMGDLLAGETVTRTFRLVNDAPFAASCRLFLERRDGGRAPDPAVAVGPLEATIPASGSVDVSLRFAPVREALHYRETVQVRVLGADQPLRVTVHGRCWVNTLHMAGFSPMPDAFTEPLPASAVVELVSILREQLRLLRPLGVFERLQAPSGPAGPPDDAAAQRYRALIDACTQLGVAVSNGYDVALMSAGTTADAPPPPVAPANATASASTVLTLAPALSLDDIYRLLPATLAGPLLRRVIGRTRFVTIRMPWQRVEQHGVRSFSLGGQCGVQFQYSKLPASVAAALAGNINAGNDRKSKPPVGEFSVERYDGTFKLAPTGDFVLVPSPQPLSLAAGSPHLGLEPASGSVECGGSVALQVALRQPLVDALEALKAARGVWYASASSGSVPAASAQALPMGNAAAPRPLSRNQPQASNAAPTAPIDSAAIPGAAPVVEPTAAQVAAALERVTAAGAVPTAADLAVATAITQPLSLESVFRVTLRGGFQLGVPRGQLPVDNPDLARVFYVKVITESSP